MERVVNKQSIEAGWNTDLTDQSIMESIPEQNKIYIYYISL